MQLWAVLYIAIAFVCISIVCYVSLLLQYVSIVYMRVVDH
jgi:hypothetical protein